MGNQELVVFIGLQGAGKSTFYRKHFAGTHALVSRDLFRHNRDPRRRQKQLIEQALASGRSVVVDNTNPTPADRAQIVPLGREVGARVTAYFFVPELRGSIARNAAREARGRVPTVAILATYKRLTPPSFAEGFDRIFRVKVAGPEAFAVDELIPAGRLGESELRGPT